MCWLCLVLTCAGVVAAGRDARAQTTPGNQKHAAAKSGNAAGAPLPALLISDIHFDPLHDPGKEQRLLDAPVGQWASILSAPDMPGAADEFASLQKACHARGVDTPWPLLRSSLHAMRATNPRPAFIAVSGDLVAHEFTCRVTSGSAEQGPAAYAAFVVKTIAFVVARIRADFPGVPVYVALGNNDSGCGDYRMDPDSRFLKQVAAYVADGVPPADRREVLQQFPVGGYYTARMPPAIRRTNLIVLNDLFLSPNYRTCDAASDPAAWSAEFAWLQRQLAQARAKGDRVWVMGHIPPGVDAYATVRSFPNLCGGEQPDLFLRPDRLNNLLMRYTDVVRLAVFGHTHMDEMRLLAPENGDSKTPAEHSVAVKLVPSITPVHGNNPSFTVAEVDPVTAALLDYRVIEASNQTGVNTTWSQEYDFDRTYRQTAYSAVALRGLIAGFLQDPKARTAASQAYIRHYYKGSLAQVLAPFWPQYACSLRNTTARSYAACVCGASK
jgi:sphingomyelin phosphodiesterase acid-like 3